MHNRLRFLIALILLFVAASVPSQPAAAQDGSCDSAPIQRLEIGDWAQVADIVAGTAAGGLRLRAEPRTSGEEVIVLPARTVVRVVNGPACNDGFRWWYVSVLETGVEGWSAEGIAAGATSFSYYLSPTRPPSNAPGATTAPQAAAGQPPAQAAQPTAQPAAQENTAPALPAVSLDYQTVASIAVETLNSVTFSPDASAAAIVGLESVQVLNATDLAQVYDFSTENLFPRSAAFSPDGNTLLVGYEEGVLIWWDVNTGERKVEDSPFAGPVTNVAFRWDGVTAAVDLEGQAALFSADGSQRGAFAVLTPTESADDWRVTTLMFSADGGQLLVGQRSRTEGLGGRVAVYAVDSPGTAQASSADLSRHTSGIFFSDPASETPLVLLYGDSSLAVQLWNPADGSLQDLTGTQGWRAVASRPDSTVLALYGDEGIVLLDFSDARVAQVAEGRASNLGFSGDGRFMLALVLGEVTLWGLEGAVPSGLPAALTQPAEGSGETQDAVEPTTAPTDEVAPTESISVLPTVTPTTEVLPTVTEAPAVSEATTAEDCPDAPAPSYLSVGVVTNVASQSHPLRYRGQPSIQAQFDGLLYQDKALTIVSGPRCADSYRWWQVEFDGQTAWVIDAASGRYLLIDPGNPPPAIVFGGPLPTETPPPTPALAETPAPTPRPTSPPSVVVKAAYTADGGTLAVGASDGVRLYSAETFEPTGTLDIGPVFDFARINGELFAVTWGVEGIRVIGVPGGQTRNTILGGPYDPAWAAASPDGTLLALGPTSDGAAATLWNLTSGRAPDTFPYWWTDSGIERLAFSPDGSYVMLDDVFYDLTCTAPGAGCLFDLIRNDYVGAGLFGGVNWTPDGSMMVGYSNRFWVWDVNTLGVGFTLQSTLSGETPSTAAISPDGLRGAVASRRLMELWNLEVGNYYTNRVVELPGAINTLEFSPDGTQIVAAAGASVQVLDPISGSVIRQVE